MQGVDELGYGFVGAVLDFVPLEGLEVVLCWSCVEVLVGRLGMHCCVTVAGHTVVHHLLLLDLVVVSLQYRP